MRSARLVPLLLCGLVAACSREVVAPSTPDGFAAVHFDQLRGSACSTDPSGSRCAFLSSFALPPAFGAASSPVSIDTGGASVDWQAFVFDVVDSNTTTHAISESIQVMAFSDTNVTNGLLLAPGASSYYLSDTATVEPSTATSIGWNALAAQGPCATPPTLRHTSVPALHGASCTVQTFSITFQHQFYQTTATFTLAPANVNGIRIVRTT